MLGVEYSSSSTYVNSMEGAYNSFEGESMSLYIWDSYFYVLLVHR